MASLTGGQSWARHLISGAASAIITVPEGALKTGLAPWAKTHLQAADAQPPPDGNGLFQKRWVQVDQIRIHEGILV